MKYTTSPSNLGRARADLGPRIFWLATLTGGLLCILALAGAADASVIFSDHFTSAELDPSWQIKPVQSSGGGAYELLPAAPGYLRYRLTNNGQTHEGPSLWVSRDLECESWQIETQVRYNMGGGQGRQLVTAVVFGEPGDWRGEARWVRDKDCCSSPSRNRLIAALNGQGSSSSADLSPNAADTYVVRFIRDGQTVTIQQRAVDETEFTTMASRTYANPLGLKQFLRITSGSHTSQSDSMDYDYVEISATCDQPANACAGTPDANGCCADPFDGSEPGSTWALSELGDATGSTADVSDGELGLSGTGSELYHGDDHGAFLQQTLAGDFRVEIDITEVTTDQGGKYRKGGLMVRGGMAPDAPRVMVQYLPHFPTPDGPEADAPALQFDYRDAAGQAAELASTVPGISLPVRVAILRLGDSFSVHYSTDGGESWIAPAGAVGGEVTIDMGETVLAGPSVTSYDPSQSFAMGFDDFSVCRPSGEAPEPTDVACNPEAGLDVIYLLDHSDSMARSHGESEDGISKFESAQAALREINAGLAMREAPTRVALVTYVGGHEPSYNLAYGAQVQAGFGSDFAAMDSLLGSFTLPVLQPYQPWTTTPKAIALNEVLELLRAERRPDHGVVVIWPNDSVPNIDALGRGPQGYAETAVAGIGLGNGFGGFLAPNRVAWLGPVNTAYAACVGQVLADTQAAIIRLRDDQGDLRILSLVPRGTVSNPPVLPEDLLDFAAFYTQGAVFGATDQNGLVDQAPAVLAELACGASGPGGISGRLWRDDDGDGTQDPGEPGLAGITLSIPGHGTAVTDADGDYAFAGLTAGPHTVSVSTGDLPADATEPTADADGIATAHTATVTAIEWAYVTADFGYRAPESGDPVTDCLEDGFDSLDPAWTLSELGNADQGAASTVGSLLWLTGDGTSAYSGSDHGAILHRRVEGDFRMEVDITGFPVSSGGAYRKAGLMVRSGLDMDDPRLMVQYVPDFGGTGRPVLQFRYRATAGGAGDLALGSNLYDVPLPVRLAVERSGNTWSVAYSTDGGTTWQQPAGGSQGSATIDLGAAPYVGMNAVSYSASTALTASFDELTICEP